MTVNNYTMSNNGLNLLKSFEGCKLYSYQDVTGIWTIGFGHTGADVSEGMFITQDQADSLLVSDLQKFCNSVNNLVTVKINQNQFDALVDFAYNLGAGNLKVSTLLRLVNSGDFADAANQFIKWDLAGGRVSEGLLRRREAEQQLFVS